MNVQRLRSRRIALVLCMFAVLATLSIARGEDALASFTSGASNSHSAATKSCFYRATVQNGTATSTTNGTTTVTITSVNTAKAFLLFSSRHDSNRPVGSEVSGRIASATTLQFTRVTDEGSPGTITIEWDVIEYNCGITVQRGSVSQSATSVDVTISAVNSLAAAFVTFSKTPNSTDTGWSSNDPVVAELTSTTNLQFRADALDGAHLLYWQVIEFTDSTMINVQKGTTSLTAAASSTTATITSVNTAKTFVLATSRSTGDSTDIGSGMVRARLTNATTITFDRGAANYDVTEIAWQAVQLKDGSSVQSGNNTLASGTASGTAALTAVSLARSSAFTSTQTGGGQNGGKTAYIADDVIGVASFMAALTSTTQLTLTRTSTAAAADVAWFVVSWGLP